MLKTFTFFMVLVLLYINGCGADEDEVAEVAPVKFISANPPAGDIGPTATILLTFDGPPTNLSVTPGIIKSHQGETVRIAGPFSPGSLHIRITWADGIKDLHYYVAVPCADKTSGCE